MASFAEPAPMGHPDRQGPKAPRLSGIVIPEPRLDSIETEKVRGTPSRIVEASGGTDSLRPLFPDHGEMHDGLRGLFHVLHADPFQPRMERVLAGENIGAGQPHERQPRAIGAAADGTLHRREAGAADRLYGVVDDVRMTVDYLLHVAVLLLDLESVGRARKILHHRFDDTFQQRFFLLQSRIE